MTTLTQATKKTDIFKAGGESWKAYNKLLDMGYIKEDEEYIKQEF